MAGFIALHIGAGDHSSVNYRAYKSCMKKAINKGREVLKCGGSAVDAVTAVIAVLEDDELTNAGFGSALTNAGTVECDAGVVDGRTGRHGAVGALAGFMNPIRIADRLLNEQEVPLLGNLVPPSLLVGDGAAHWATLHNFIPLKNKAQLISDKSLQRHRRVLRQLRKLKNKQKQKNAASKAIETAASQPAEPMETLSPEPCDAKSSKCEQSMPPPADITPPPLSSCINSPSATQFLIEFGNPSSSLNSVSANIPASCDAGVPESSNCVNHPEYAPHAGGSEAICDGTAKLPDTNDIMQGDASSDSVACREMSALKVSPANKRRKLAPCDEHESDKSPSDRLCTSPDFSSSTKPQEEHCVQSVLDTVGCVVVTADGAVAAGASSGGILLKQPGRVGQAALLGSGFWAEENCEDSGYNIAVCTSGCGEMLVSTQLAMRAAGVVARAEDDVTEIPQQLQRLMIDSKFLQSYSNPKLSGCLILKHNPQDGYTDLYCCHSSLSFGFTFMGEDESGSSTMFSTLYPEQEGQYLRLNCFSHSAASSKKKVKKLRKKKRDLNDRKCDASSDEDGDA